MAELIEVRRCGSRDEARQHGLVLTAVGIESYLVPQETGVALYVAETDADRAQEQLALYEWENAAQSPSWRPSGLGGHGLEAAMAYAAVLTFFFAAQGRGAFGIDWVVAGAAQAGQILDGAWWRTLTALSLHGDLAHLVANLAFGMVYAMLLAGLVGSGVTWFCIVLAGGLGNGLNAALQAATHTSIGASTSVFAALGLLAGFVQCARPAPWRPGLRRWAPIAGGVMLLAFLGFGGERTDIGAHIAGFLVGGAMGVALAFGGRRWLRSSRVQSVCGALACGLFALAWSVAVSG
jgi:membrane associated rhomboid family serine protease